MNFKLSNPNADACAKQLFEYLCSVYGKKILTAQQECGHHEKSNMEVDFIKEKTGHLPAIRGLDFISDGFGQIVERAKKWHSLGGIVTICWHCGINGGGYKQSQEDVPDFDKLFEDGSPEQTAMLESWDRAANALAQLRDAGIPVLWRPFHEFDGGWFWWGKGGAECFIRLWRMMYERFTKQFNLTNLIWVLGYADDVREGWYVGDDYCDIVGSDTYRGGVHKPGFDRLSEVAPNKPRCFHECGILPEIEEFENSGCMWMWFMIWHTKWLFDNDEEGLKAFYNSDKALTLDDTARDLNA